MSSYRPNGEYFSNVFAVPAALAENLGQASADELKAALLFFACSGSEDPVGEVARGLGIGPETAADLLRRWVKLGLIIDGDAPEAAPEEKKAPSPAKKAGPARAEKLSPAQIKKRLAEDEGAAFLLTEGQKALGRTIGPSDQSVLLDLLDSKGLGAEVILTVLGAAAGSGRSNDMRYVYRVGCHFAETGVNTCRDAVAYFDREAAAEKLWDELCGLTGIKKEPLSFKNGVTVARWKFDLGYDVGMIALAYSFNVGRSNGFSFAYVDKTLASWSEAGVKTQEEAKEFVLSRRSGKKSSDKKPAPAPDEKPASATRSDGTDDPDFTFGISRKARRKNLPRRD